MANQAQKIQVDSDVNQWNYVNDDASKKTWSKKGDFKHQAVDGSLDLHSYAVPHPDVFWAYRFLEIKNWIV